jgi:replicative DNA helicase
MNIYEKIRSNKLKVLNNEVISIPWPFEKLNKVLAGIQKGRYYLITGGPKSGKTQIADALITYNIIDWYLENKNHVNIKPTIFYFTLELTAEYKQLMLISRQLYKRYNKIINPEKLMSFHKNYIIDDETERQIKDIQETYLNETQGFLKLIEDAKTPKQIYKYIMDYIRSSGKIIKEKITTKDGEEIEIFKNYIPNNENEFIFVVIDHIGLVVPSKGDTLHKAISDLSSMLVEMRNKYGIIPVIIQQQALDTEKQQYTYKGEAIIEKLKPTVSGLGDNKYTSRDADLVFGIFSPDKFGIEVYNRYEIYKLKDMYRELLILVNRHGRSNLSLNLQFIGDVNYFAELPSYNETSKIIKIYKFAQEFEKFQLGHETELSFL